MEHVLLFFCRACLKGEGDNREYYDLLGIEDPKRASTETIKMAYKKRSLQMHPDKLAQRGIEVTKEHSIQFQKMKEAYDILSDPRKRRLYDEIGASGLKLLESPTEVNPMDVIKNFQKNRADRAKIALMVALIFAIILLEPILFCLKCDNRISSLWLAIWAPMWGVDFILLASAVLLLMDKNERPTEEDQEPPEKIPLPYKLYNLWQTLLFLLAQIFILMRLDARVRWSLNSVFAPWYAWESCMILTKLIPSFKPIPKPNLDANTDDIQGLDEEKVIHRLTEATEYYERVNTQITARKSIAVGCLRIWFGVFLAYQVDHDKPWSWGLVFLPVWIYFVLQFAVAYTLRRWGLSLVSGLDLEAILAARAEIDPMTMLKIQHGQELAAAGFAGYLFQIAPIFMLVLVVVRLEGVDVSTFVIILPVYLAIFCCICGVGCGLFCLSNISMEDEQEGYPQGKSDAQSNYVPPNLQSSSNDDRSPPVYGTFKPNSNSNSAGDNESKSPVPTQAFVMPPPPPPASQTFSAPLPLPPLSPPQPPVTHEAVRIDVDID